MIERWLRLLWGTIAGLVVLLAIGPAVIALISTVLIWAVACGVVAVALRFAVLRGSFWR
ncbi:MAG TPA: hypothetical protein VN238_05950 [Solirubrobacteraceae bacterium]|nr:hypothetical protein [Solirubrobacteraceae bacterium]